MSIHVFANFVTPYGTAANNRAENEGNMTTLQKLLWMGDTHSTVSAEAIRFALRRRFAEMEKEGTNRNWDEDVRANSWKDPSFKSWAAPKNKTFIDDDLLGFMIAEAAKEEGESGSANVRRAVLEVTRAVSLTPWVGDVSFNAASPGATPSAQKKGVNPAPYGTELHATRYQYGIALTPERLRDKSRAAKAVEALCSIGTVAGNHGRFLFDFSPEIVVFRLISASGLLKRLKSGDILKEELILGVSDIGSELALKLKGEGVETLGVKAACSLAVNKINSALKV